MNLCVPEDARLEIKFSAYEVHLHSLLNWIRLHSYGFIIPFPDRWVNNVYFDTQDYHAYNENLSGVSSRTKVRYRWYGESNCPDKGALEIKCKRNLFGWKHRYPISEPPGKLGFSWKDIVNAILKQLPPDGKNFLNASPFPIMINRYYRKYFLSADGKIRVTLDTKQAVWDQRYKSYPNFEHQANIAKALVLEVKFDRKDRELASQIIQGIPLRVSKQSKYMNAVGAIRV